MDEESDDHGSVSAAPKKRGKKSKARTDTEEVEELDTRVSKKARTDTTHKTAQESDIAIQDDDQDVVMSDMGSYDSWPSWEDLIRSIDTIERDDSGKIQVYFTLYVFPRIYCANESITSVQKIGCKSEGKFRKL
jgi:hypothetical protein